MKTKLTLSILAIFLLASVSALYGGESITIDLEKEYEYYSIVGNSTEVILDIQENGTQVTITPDKYSLTDTYEIVFFDKEKETITVYRGGGGGRTRTKTIYKDRNITEYKDRIEYNDRVIEGETKTKTEYLDRISDKEKTIGLIITCLFLFILIIFVIKLIKAKDEANLADEDYNNYTIESKGGKSE